jgi:hypothetical protein
VSPPQKPFQSGVKTAPKEFKKATISEALQALERVETNLSQHVPTRAKAEQKAASMSFAGTLKVGVYELEGKTTIVVPSNFFYEDSPLGGLIVDLCEKTLRWTVYVVQSEGKISQTEENERFLLGLWLGFFSETLIKRGRSKKDYELGRACTQALLVREVFNFYPHLGGAALKQDNFFFGNYSLEENDKGVRVPFYLKERLAVIIHNSDELTGFLGILNKIAQSWRLRCLPEEELSRTLEYNLRSFDEVAQKYFKPKLAVVKRKQVVVGYRTPDLPSQSPVFLKEEMRLITGLLSIHWRSLDPLKESWADLIFNSGYRAIEARIASAYSERWQNLSRFAQFTTKRLQRIRKANPAKSRTKKAQTSREDVLVYLHTQAAPATALREELKHLIPNTQFKAAMEGFTKKSYHDLKEAEQDFIYLSQKAYLETDAYGTNKAEDVKPIDAVELQEWEKYLKHFQKLSQNMRQLRLLEEAVSTGYRLSRMPGWIRSATNYIVSIGRSYAIIKDLSEEQQDLFFEQAFLPQRAWEDVVHNCVFLCKEVSASLRKCYETNTGKALTGELDRAVLKGLEALEGDIEDILGEATLDLFGAL